MDYFLAHSDESCLDIESLSMTLRSSPQIIDVKDTGCATPSILLAALYWDDSGTVDLRISKDLVALEGDDQSMLNCSLWIQSQYSPRLDLCHPSTNVGVSLHGLLTVDELLERMAVWEE